MGMKSIGKFYTDVTTAIAIAANGLFNFNTARTCGSVSESGTNTINITAPGVYNVSANVTFVGTAVGTVGATLYADGVAVAGARGTETITAIGNARTIAFDTVLTVSRTSSGVAQLTLVNTSDATSYTVANVIVEKIA